VSIAAGRASRRSSFVPGLNQVLRDVDDELAAGRLALAPSIRGRLEQVLVGVVVLVEGPVADGVGAGYRNLEHGLGKAGRVGELGVVEGGAQRDRPDDGRLAVVLVVEGADAAAALEAVRVTHSPVVHLGALLLAVIDDVQAGALL